MRSAWLALVVVLLAAAQIHAGDARVPVTVRFVERPAADGIVPVMPQRERRRLLEVRPPESDAPLPIAEETISDCLAEPAVEGDEPVAPPGPPPWLIEAADNGRAVAEEDLALALQQVATLAVWQAVNEALSLPDLGRDDLAMGREQGVRDGAGGEWGRHCGAAVATEEARADAEREVERRFHDLARDPDSAVTVMVPALSGCVPEFAANDVGVLVAENPERWEGPVAEVMRPHRMTLARLVGLAEAELDVPRWEVDEHLARWQRDERRSVLYQGLPFGLRRAAEAAFCHQYELTVAAGWAEVDAIWDSWLAAGWELGVDVGRELAFREGVLAGFRQTAVAAAAAAYAETYPGAYRVSFAKTFVAWAESVRAEVAWLEVEPADAVVRPGDLVRVELAIANYGGRDGVVEIRLDGGELEAMPALTVRLPRRSIRHLEPLRARVRGDLTGRRASLMDVVVGDQRRSVGLVVETAPGDGRE